MPEAMHAADAERLCRIEPDDRVVVLARTMDVREAEAEATLKESAFDWSRHGDACIGKALYRRRSTLRNGTPRMRPLGAISN